MEKSYVYRSIEGLKLALVILLSLELALNVVSIGSSWMQIELLQTNFTDEEAERNDVRETAIAITYICTLFLTFIVFGVWIVRAQRNVWALGHAQEITPG